MFQKWLGENPALQREWQALRRGRRPEEADRQPWQWMGLLGVLGLYGASAWWFSLARVTPWQARSVLFAISLGCLLLQSLLLPGYAVNLLAREKRQDRWQELLLTSLEPSQIVAAKLLAAIYPTWWSLALLLPILLMGSHASRLTPDSCLLLLVVLTAAGLPAASLSLWLALRIRQSRTAMLLAYLFTNLGFWGSLIWFEPWYVHGENLWWYASPAWHTGLLVLARSNASPLVRPLLPEWAWFTLGSLGLTAVFFQLMVRRVAFASGER